mmetsp:Transcript_13532/g.32654  ORF Transcript_13532/g.32654 Transcript_13532/m.32654 type:complete len:200 (+) Transcript_13532:2488-3087(+)
MVIDSPRGSQNSNKFQIMSLSTLVIIWIMGGCNLNSSRTKVHVDQIGIRNNGNLASAEGMNDLFAMQMLVTWIFGVNGNGSISQHGFQTCRGDNQLFVGIFNRVGKASKSTKFVSSLGILGITLVCLDFQKGASLQINIVHLNIGNGRFQSTRPVSKTIGSIQQSSFMESVKGFTNSLTEHVVHGKSFTRPIDRRTQRP